MRITTEEIHEYVRLHDKLQELIPDIQAYMRMHNSIFEEDFKACNGTDIPFDKRPPRPYSEKEIRNATLGSVSTDGRCIAMEWDTITYGEISEHYIEVPIEWLTDRGSVRRNLEQQLIDIRKTISEMRSDKEDKAKQARFETYLNLKREFETSDH